MAAFQSGTIHIKEKSTTQANADAGWLRVYAKADGSIYRKDENGVEYRFMGSTEVASISGSLQSQITAISSKLTKTYQASDLDSPNNSNWAVNAFAPIVAVSGAAGLTARSFNDTTSQGVGFGFSLPSNATTIQINVTGRAETTPASGYNLIQNVYVRSIPNNGGSLSSWSSPYSLSTIGISANNISWIDSQNTISMATLGVSAGNWTQFEIVRKTAGVSNNLVGNWLNLEYEVLVY